MIARAAPRAAGGWRAALRKAGVALAILVGSGAGLTAARAQPSAQPAPTAQSAQPAQAQQQRRAEIRKKLLAFRAYRVTEELQLDEAGATRVFPLLTKYDQQIEQLTLERFELHKALRQNPTDAKVIDDLIRRTLANRRAFVELEERRIGELRKVLSPVQTARLLVVLPEIEQQIKSQIRRSVRRQDAGDRGSRGNRDDGGGALDPFQKRNKRKRNKLPRAELDELE